MEVGLTSGGMELSLTGLSLMGDNMSLESLIGVELVTALGITVSMVSCLMISLGDTTSSLNTSSLSSSVSTPDNPPLPLESVRDLCELEAVVPVDPSWSSLFLLVLK